MLEDILFKIIIGKLLILLLTCIFLYFIFAKDIFGIIKELKKWEKNHSEMQKQKLEMMKAKTEMYKKMGKEKDTN